MTILLPLSVIIAAALGLWVGRLWGRQAGASAVLDRLGPQLQTAQTRLAVAEQDALHQKQTIELQREGLLGAKEGAAAMLQELSTAKSRVAELEAVNAKDKEAFGLQVAEVERLRDELRGARLVAKEEAAALQQSLATAKAKSAELETAAAKDKEAFAAERKRFDEAQSQAQQTFENLANKIFESKSASFDTKSREGLGALLLPFKEQLESFRKRVDQVHTESVQGQTSLKGELENLRRLNQQVTEEASNLTKALKGDKKIQGDWGEQKLEILLERSGLRKGVEYEAQRAYKSLDGDNLRPDFVVYLPEGKHIIIDSKVSLVDYAAYVAVDEPEARQMHLAAHVAAIRAHIKSLSGKRYPDLVGLESPDFTLMFIAIEPAYLAAAEHDQSLFQDAYDARVALVTATTLMPILKVIDNLWTLQRRNKSTQELAAQASRVADKLGIFVEKMKTLGNQLNTAQKTYHETMKTLSEGKGNLVSTVANFEELGAKVQPKLLELALDENNTVDGE